MFRPFGLLAFLPVFAALVGCSRPSETNSAPVEQPTASSVDVPGWGLEVAPMPRELVYLEVTPAAAREVKRHAAGMKAERWWLRFTIQGNACDGFRNKIDLDVASPTSEDIEFVANGIPCVIRSRHSIFIRNVRIDFGDNNGKTGFMITHPFAVAPDAPASKPNPDSPSEPK